jgi:hypothetical protein
LAYSTSMADAVVSDGMKMSKPRCEVTTVNTSWLERAGARRALEVEEARVGEEAAESTEASTAITKEEETRGPSGS